MLSSLGIIDIIMIMLTSETSRFTAQTQLQSVVYVVVAILNLLGVHISHGVVIIIIVYRHTYYA